VYFFTLLYFTYIVFKTSGSIKERTQTSTEMGGGCQQNGCCKGFALIKQLANC